MWHRVGCDTPNLIFRNVASVLFFVVKANKISLGRKKQPKKLQSGLDKAEPAVGKARHGFKPGRRSGEERQGPTEDVKGVKGRGDAVSRSSQEREDQSHSTCAVTDVGAGQRWRTREGSRLPLTCTSQQRRRRRGPPGRARRGIEARNEPNI